MLIATANQIRVIAQNVTGTDVQVGIALYMYIHVHVHVYTVYILHTCTSDTCMHTCAIYTWLTLPSNLIGLLWGLGWVWLTVR